jgi:hypothetical protein
MVQFHQGVPITCGGNMSEYKVVMLMRKSDSVELLEELSDINFEEQGVKIEIMEDALFDSYINLVKEVAVDEG